MLRGRDKRTLAIAFCRSSCLNLVQPRKLKKKCQDSEPQEKQPGFLEVFFQAVCRNHEGYNAGFYRGSTNMSRNAEVFFLPRPGDNLAWFIMSLEFLVK